MRDPRILNSIDTLRACVHEWRAAGLRVSFVPTMGNLHAGHLRLVDVAATHADKVIVSIYVNPLQFGPAEDFKNYPRTLDQDVTQLRTVPADAVFVPAEQIMYGNPGAATTSVEVPHLSQLLEGASRPGHFRGVATVVTKLFNLVQPDVAVFGEKDFQQLLVIRRLVADLAFPVTIVGEPTVREADGLAMSSRNGYLTSAQRQLAPRLYQVLCRLREQLLTGSSQSAQALENWACQTLEAQGFRPDYVCIRRASDLEVTDDPSVARVIVAAAYLGKTRLIDNIRV